MKACLKDDNSLYVLKEKTYLVLLMELYLIVHKEDEDLHLEDAVEEDQLEVNDKFRVHSLVILPCRLKF